MEIGPYKQAFTMALTHFKLSYQDYCYKELSSHLHEKSSKHLRKHFQNFEACCDLLILAADV